MQSLFLFHVSPRKYEIGDLIQLEGESNHARMCGRHLQILGPNRTPPTGPLVKLDPDTGYPIDNTGYWLLVPKSDWMENQWRATQLVELLFEEIREREFLEKPSRFESFFAFETQSDAENFRMGYGRTNCYIYQIQVEESAITHGADWHWLDCASMSLEVIEGRAREYWKGSCTEDPVWEWLNQEPCALGAGFLILQALLTRDKRQTWAKPPARCYPKR